MRQVHVLQASTSYKPILTRSSTTEPFLQRRFEHTFSLICVHMLPAIKACEKAIDWTGPVKTEIYCEVGGCDGATPSVRAIA